MIIWDGMVRLEVELNVVSSTFEQLHMTLGDARQDPNIEKHVMKHKRLKTEQVVPYLQDFPFPYYVVVQDKSDSLKFFVLTRLSRHRNSVILMVFLFTIVS